MPALKFGVGLFPTGPMPDMLRASLLAEELGFDSLWVADTHLIWRDVYVLLGAVAARAQRMALGTGVTHAQVRHVSLTAAAIASLAELAPGRVNLGIGVGDSGPANMGLPRASLGALEEAIGQLRALMRGEEISLNGTPLRLAYASGQAVPIYVAGASDRTHRFGGRVADGVYVAGAVDELASSVAAIREGEREASRPAGSAEVVLWTVCSIDDDPAVAREAVRPVVARKAIISFGRAERLGRLSTEDREPFERLRSAYDTHHHMGAMYADMVPDRWVERYSIAGTAEEVRERCRRAADEGADHIAMVFMGPDLERQLRRFAEAVVRPLAGRLAG
jgi:5,10-methylenetetrahydromethanopterin reductase